jgi:hypothetical protein
LAPGSLKTECTALVDQFGPTIVDLLIKYGNDTKKVCQTIKVCPANTVSVKADPPLCTLCEYVVQYADNLIQQNKTEQQIIKDLGKFDSFFNPVNTSSNGISLSDFIQA